jgi:magnesium-transporting ATPase (P-type)
MALAVGLTPELLPMIVTTLARGAQRMAEAKVVVKRLSAIHDLGEMDVLCTDKTGTLTEARIALVGHPGIEGSDRDRVFELAAVNARFETGLKSPLDEACWDMEPRPVSRTGSSSTSVRSISNGGAFRCWPSARASGSRSSRARPRPCSACARGSNWRAEPSLP